MVLLAVVPEAVAEEAEVAAGRDAARAIIIRDDAILVMKRWKSNVGDYVVLLGGRVEPNESPEEAAVREVLEESGVRIINPRLVFVEEPHGKWGKQYIFLCDYLSGEPKLPEDSEEFAAQQSGLYGTYQPVWMSIKQLELSETPFRTQMLKQELIAAIKVGFPKAPKQWTPASE